MGRKESRKAMRAWTGLVAATLFVAYSAGSGAAQGIPDLVARARPAVAIVVTRGTGGLSQGSGFVYDSRGFLLTAAHVVEGASEIVVRLPEYRPLIATVAQTNRQLDVAALRVSQEGLPTIPLASTSRPRVGEEIVVLGYPRAETIGFEDLTVTRGVVSRVLVSEGLIQFDASINPGNSGGPVLNLRGEAVGIVRGGLRGTVGINFAVLGEVASDVARLALQAPYAPPGPRPTTSPVSQPPERAAPPSPAVTPGPGDWTVIGSKGPTPQRTDIRTPSNLAIREARYRVEGARLLLQIELYEKPTGDSRLSLFWRLAGATQPAYALNYHLSYRTVEFGRVALSDPTRRLWRVEPIPQPGIRVNVTGSFIDVELPLE
jgi:hypothetical protein